MNFWYNSVKVPQEMVNVAKRFIKHHVKRKTNDDDIDQAVDVAFDEWLTWSGRAFNQGLKELGLIEDE